MIVKFKPIEKVVSTDKEGNKIYTLQALGDAYSFGGYKKTVVDVNVSRETYDKAKVNEDMAMNVAFSAYQNKVTLHELNK